MSKDRRSAAGDGDVVVGVDGSRAGVQALRYAVAEAARLGAGVHVVHAVPIFVPMTPMYPLPVDDLTTAGQAVVQRTVDEARAPESTRLATSLSREGAVPALLAVSEDAPLVVLGADRRPVAARIFTGNVSTAVAASSRAPVVTVPETWPGGEPTGTVLVGIKRPDGSPELLAEAFATAQTRGARLVVLHAWRLPSFYEDVVAHRVAETDWAERAHEEVDRELEQWRAVYPDVEVEVRVVHDQPAHALVSASERVDEIVLVRRPRGVAAALHLGPTARAVMANAHCPVRIVPSDRGLSTADLVLEDAGELNK
ncbi:universal stress protein [Nocardioides sp. zg-1228]|uniref:universal stress protein n=1 Tax=Nocardioides sp. zg-1228 TaxID=2763008 RepID=UPI001642609E|nr:universal stress protein [Nocardioides sp. zg-1228]MBC2934276.1 universal stress protein [Nocardioides sp. zg-1228]QSF59055.1 universal stress protein [Nocardioides sp. zg-1228]